MYNIFLFLRYSCLSHRSQCHPGLVLSGHLQFIAYVSTMLGTGMGAAYTVSFAEHMLR